MAWSSPRTWSAAEVVTAAIMNTHVRDELNYLKGNAGAVVISDELSSTTAAGGTLTAEGTNNASFGRLRILAKRTAGTVVDWRWIANGLSDAGELTLYDGTAVAERLRIDNTGKVGIGTTSPQGKLHGYDTIGGFLHWIYNGVDNTIRNVLPTSSVASNVAGFYLCLPSGGSSPSGGTWTIGTAAGTFNIYDDGGTNRCLLRLNSGALECQRTLGSKTYQVVLWTMYL